MASRFCKSGPLVSSVHLRRFTFGHDRGFHSKEFGEVLLGCCRSLRRDASSRCGTGIVRGHGPHSRRSGVGVLRVAPYVDGDGSRNGRSRGCVSRVLLSALRRHLDWVEAPRVVGWSPTLMVPGPTFRFVSHVD